MLNEGEMPKLLSQTVEKGMKCPGKWACSNVRLKETPDDYIPWRGLLDAPLPSSLSNAFMRGVITLLKSSVRKLFYKTGLTVEKAITELGSIIAMGMLGLQNKREWVVSLNCQKEDGCNFLNEWQSHKVAKGA